jgi:hypothetical protein
MMQTRNTHLQTPSLTTWVDVILLAMIDESSILSITVVLPSADAVLAVRRRLVELKKTAVGLNLITPFVLLKRLANHFGMSEIQCPNVLEKSLLRIAASESVGNPYAAIAQSNPAKILRTLRALHKAKISPAEANLSVLAGLDVVFNNLLKKGGFVSHNHFEELLTQKASKGKEKKLFDQLYVVGFGLEHSEYDTLLQAAMSVCAEWHFVHLGELRCVGQQAWFGTWEQRLGDCEPLFGEPSAFEQLSLAVEKGASCDCNARIAVGKTIADEAAWIAEQCAQWTQSDSGSIAVVIDRSHAALRSAVISILRKNHVPHYDAVGTIIPFNAEENVIRLWIDWQRSGRIQDLIAYLDVIIEDSLTSIRLKKILEDAARNTFSSQADVVLVYAREELIAYRPVLNRAKRLPMMALALDYKFILQDLSTLASLPISEWMRWLDRLSSVLLSRDCILEWVRGALENKEPYREAIGDHPYAHVVITTPEAARFGNWKYVILSGLNAAVMFTHSDESTLLSEDTRLSFWNAALIQGNQGEGHVVLNPENGWLIPSHFLEELKNTTWLDLLAAPSKGLAVSVTHEDPKEPGQSWPVGDFFERIVRSVGEARVGYFSYAFRASIKKGPQLGATTGMPIDNLSPSAWERLLLAPVQGWLEHVVGAKPEDDLFAGSFSLMKGVWIHDWLSSKREGIWERRMTSFDEWKPFLQAASSSHYARVKAAYEAANKKINPIFESTWRQAITIAEQLGHKALTYMPEANWMIQEWSLAEGLQLKIPQNNQPFSIRGRMDLVFSHTNEPQGSAMLIDFKTGSQTRGWTVTKIETESTGVQLVLYGLALKQMGYESVSLVRLSTESANIIALDALESDNPLWKRLSVLRNHGLDLGERHLWESSVYGPKLLWPRAFLRLLQTS